MNSIQVKHSGESGKEYRKREQDTANWNQAESTERESSELRREGENGDAERKWRWF